MSDVLTFERPPLAPIEFRTAETLDVRFPDRTIELVAVPYDEECVAEHRGRLIIETIAPGAFDGVERRANRVKVNRDHDRERSVGRAVALHPTRPEGLVSELRIARTPLGDETLELAADGVLDASVGFAVFPGHDEWSEDRSRRRCTKCWLSHIAMVAEPAYESANILAVRHVTATPPDSDTPNLDAIRLAQLTERFVHGR